MPCRVVMALGQAAIETRKHIPGSIHLVVHVRLVRVADDEWMVQQLTEEQVIELRILDKQNGIGFVRVGAELMSPCSVHARDPEQCIKTGMRGIG